MSLGASNQVVGDIGEFQLIERLTGGLNVERPVRVGIGDDAAVLGVVGDMVVTTDALIEGTHFRTDWSSARHVGRKSLAVNVADVEAMGARPIAVTVALSLPPGLALSWALEFQAGLMEEAELAGVQLVGGDTTSGDRIAICVTALGDTDNLRPVKRSGARPGQTIALRGRIGWAAGGLIVLSRGFKSPRELVAAQQCPSPPYGQGRRALECGATSMIDVSDGLVADLGHIAKASHVAMDVSSEALEIPEPLARLGAATGVDALHVVLTGGEDHALVATFADEIPSGWTPIGQVGESPGEGEARVSVDGEPWSGSGGFDHFGRRAN